MRTVSVQRASWSHTGKLWSQPVYISAEEKPQQTNLLFSSFQMIYCCVCRFQSEVQLARVHPGEAVNNADSSTTFIPASLLSMVI